MDRRELLAGGLLLGAAVAMPGEAQAGPLDTIERYLRRASHRQERLVARVAPLIENVFDPLRSLLPPGTLQSLFGALQGLMEYASLHELNQEQQLDPRVQQRITATAAGFGAAATALADAIEHLGDEMLCRIHALLNSGEDSGSGVLAEVFSEIDMLDLPRAARRQLDRSARQTYFDLCRGGRIHATRRVVSRFRRLQRTVANAQDPTSLLSTGTVQRAAFAEDPPHRSSSHAGTKASPGDSLSGDASETSYEPLTRGQQIALGALLLGLGLAGIGALILGAGISGGWALLCVCVGVPLIVSCVALLAGGVVLLAGE